MFEIEPQDSFAIVRPRVARLDYQTGKLLVSALRQAMEHGPHVILNLEHVDYLNSEALGNIGTCAKRLHHRQGSLKICCLAKAPSQLFHVTRMNQVLDGLFATEAEAIESFSATCAHSRCR